MSNVSEPLLFSSDVSNQADLARQLHKNLSVYFNPKHEIPIIGKVRDTHTHMYKNRGSITKKYIADTDTYKPTDLIS